MSLEISQLSIQVKSDGVTTAATGLESIAVAGTKAEAGANAAKVALANLAPSLDGVSKSAANMIIKQQQQIDLYGKGREESMAYQATIKGLSESQVLLAGGLGAQMDAMKLLGTAQAEAIAMNSALAKSNGALGESEVLQASRLRKVAEEAVARQAAMRADQGVSVASPNVWRYGSSGSAKSSGATTAMAMTPSITRDANAAEKAIRDTASLAAAEDILGQNFQKTLKVVDPFGEKLEDIAFHASNLQVGLDKGWHTQEQYNSRMANLNLQKAATELKMTEQAAKDAGEGMLQFSMKSSIAKREAITMARELARGDFTRMAGSMSIFANATGLMGTAMAVAASPITWVVVGLTGLGLAALKGSSEMSDFNKSLIMTGNYSSLTADQFSRVSKELGGIGGEGQHAASAALTEIAATGKFTASELMLVGRAAIEMQEGTGQAVQQTVKEFEKLKDEPVKASLELTDKYHYLTVAVYEQIKALEDQGDHVGAVNLAIHTMADSIAERVPQEVANIGLLETAWNKVKAAIVGVANGAMSIGRQQSSQEQIAMLQAKMDFNNHEAKSGGWSGMSQRSADAANKVLSQQVDEIRKHMAASDIVGAVGSLNSESNDRAVKATAHAQDRMDSISKEAKLQKALNVLKQEYIDMNNGTGEKSKLLKGVSFGADGMTPSGGAYDAAKQAEIDKYTPKGRKPRSNEYGIKDQIAKQQTAYAQEEQDLAQNLKDIKNLYDIGQSDQKTFLAETLEAKDEALGKEYNIATKEYEIAKGEKNLAAKEKYATLMQTILGKMVNNSTQFASDIAKVQNDEVNAIAAYSAKLTKVETLRQDEMDNAIKSSKVGATTAAQYALLLKLQKEYDTQMAALDASHDKTKPGSITDEAYAADVARLKAHHATMVASETKFVADMKDVDSKWQTGADKAFDAYQTSAANIASQSETAFTNAFTGMENALTSFATTGKLSFKSLVTSILTDIARMEAKAATSKLLGVLMEMGQAYFGSGTGATTQSAPASTQVYSQASGYKLGGAFDSGVQKFADGGSFTNGVVNSPTNFNMGQMGEAGPEAIVPLTRTSDGSLGVKQTGGSGGSSGPVNVNTVVNVSGGSATANTTTGDNATQVHKQFADAMSNAAQAEIAKQMRQGGLLWKMKNGQTGGNG